MVESPKLMFIIGAPASGKGTIGKLLAADYGYHHVSIGDVLRRIRDENRPEDEDIVRCVDRGELVSTRALLGCIERAISQISGRAVLLDGFPRQIEQGKAGEGEIGLVPNLVTFFDCPKEVAKTRFLTRKIDGRLDDDAELFEKRYHEFELLNRKVIDYYQGLGKLIVIDSSTDTGATYRKVIDALSQTPNWVLQTPKFISGPSA